MRCEVDLSGVWGEDDGNTTYYHGVVTVVFDPDETLAPLARHRSMIELIASDALLDEDLSSSVAILADAVEEEAGLLELADVLRAALPRAGGIWESSADRVAFAMQRRMKGERHTVDWEGSNDREFGDLDPYADTLDLLSAMIVWPIDDAETSDNVDDVLNEVIGRIDTRSAEDDEDLGEEDDERDPEGEAEIEDTATRLVVLEWDASLPLEARMASLRIMKDTI